MQRSGLQQSKGAAVLGAVLAYLHRDQCRNIPQHLGQLAGIDLVKKAVELDVLRHSRARAKQIEIIPERLLEIRNSQAIVIEHRRDISVILLVELLEDALRHVRRRTAK